MSIPIIVSSFDLGILANGRAEANDWRLVDGNMPLFTTMTDSSWMLEYFLLTVCLSRVYLYVYLFKYLYLFVKMLRVTQTNASEQVNCFIILLLLLHLYDDDDDDDDDDKCVRV